MHVSDHVILNAVVKALEGSSPFYSFRIVDGLYVATGFVVVPLADQVDDLTLLEAMGSPSVSKDGAEELAAHALIVAAEREFSVVVKDFNFDAVKVLRIENEKLRKNNRLLRSAWVQSLDHLETLQKTLEEITNSPWTMLVVLQGTPLLYLLMELLFGLRRMFGMAPLPWRTCRGTSWMRTEMIAVGCGIYILSVYGFRRS